MKIKKKIKKIKKRKKKMKKIKKKKVGVFQKIKIK